MRIDKISFSASNIGVKTQKIKATESEYKKENTEKNSNTKYVIGTLIGVAALTGMVIAGRKGYLGEKMQNILGGGVKKSKDIQNKITINPKDETVSLKEAAKISKKTNDIIKDGKKVGIEIKEYKGDDLICTTTKILDDDGNINKINEKYANRRNIEIKKTKVNHNNKEYTVWRYFEIPEKGSAKSINFKLDDNNDYTFDLICVTPEEITSIKQKLADNGVKFGKCLTNYYN